MLKRCPGMDPAYFTPDDIQIGTCLHCGSELEFWKDDVRLVCPDCHQETFNPNLGNTCIVWCKDANKCVGTEDLADWMERNQSQ